MAVKKIPEGHNRVSPYLIVNGAEPCVMRNGSIV